MLINAAALPRTHESDFACRNDHKSLHAHGAYAGVKFTFNEEAHSRYTGLFEADSVDYGLISYSPGFKVPNITNFFGVSIRSFRDNSPAGAIIAVSP